MKNIKYIVFLLLSLLLPLQSISAQNMIVTAAAFKTSTFLEVPVKYADIDFSATAASESFAVKTNTSVKPVSDVSWLKAEMKGDSVKVSVEANQGKSRRTAVLRLAAPDGNSKTVTVTQLGTDPDFILRADTVKVNGCDATVVMHIVANSPLTFTPSDSWLTPIDVTSFDGVKDYTYKAGTMQEGERYGNITVSVTADATKTAKVVVDQTFEGYPMFLVMSDTHIGAGGQTDKMRESLKNLYGYAGSADALFVVGDLTNSGNLSQYNEFKTIFTDPDIIPEDVQRYFIMGNHEWYTSDGNGSMNNYNSLGQDHNKYFDIKGYPFIYIGLSGGSEDNYSNESISFLKESLKDAALHYKGKPIFVFQHIPPFGTVQGSRSDDGAWGSKKVYDVLKDYPQVVDFSGHTHFSSRCPLTLWQDKFTAINDGGNLDCYVREGNDVDGLKPEGTGSMSEGMYVSVEDGTTFTVSRYDMLRNEEIGAPLTFTAPYDGTHFTYASYKGSKPVFEETGVVTRQMQPTQRMVQFPQAVISDDDPNDVVLYYKVDIIDQTGTVVATGNRSSRFYMGSSKPDSLSILISNINVQGMLKARVTAIDPYGNESDPIESEEFEQGSYTPAEGTTVPEADLLNLYVEDDGTGVDKSAMNNVVVTSENKPVPFYDSDYKLPGAKFSKDASQYYYIDYNGNEKIEKAFTSDFTMETFFFSSDVSFPQTPMSSQEQGGLGYWMEGGSLYFYVSDADGKYYSVKSSAPLQGGKYYHAVATYSTSDRTLRLYINGYPAGETLVEPDLGLVRSECRHLIIGGDVGPDGLCQFPLNGCVMVARLYSRAITRDEDYVLYKDVIKNYQKQEADTSIAAVAPVADLFDVSFGENGAVSDASAQAIAITTGQTVPTTYYNDEWKRWFAKFPGDDGQCYYGIPYTNNDAIKAALLSDFSIEALCVVNNDNLDSTLPAVLSSQQQGGIGIEPGSVMEGWGYYSGSYATAYGYDYPVQKNTVYHVVLTVQTVDVETPTMSLYVNGAFAGKAQLGGVMTLPQGNATYFCIGGDAAYSGDAAEYLLNGEVGLARMYSSALTAPQVKRLYVDLKK